MRVCVGSPGTFSTLKWRSATLAICGRCVIVITCARSARRRSVSATACAVWPPMPASISSKTIVVPAADRGDRERDPRQLAAGGRLGDRRERQALVRTDEEGHLVGAGRARAPARQLDPELALAEPDPVRARPATASGERLGGGAPVLREALRQLLSASSRASASALGCRLAAGRRPSSSAASSRSRLRRAGQELAVRLAAGSAASCRRSARARTRPARAGRAPPRASRGSGAARAPSPPGAARRPAARRRRARAPARSRRTGASARSRGADECRRRLHRPRVRAPAPPARAASRELGRRGAAARVPRAAHPRRRARGPRCPRRAPAARRAAPRPRPHPGSSSSCRRRAAPSSRHAARSSDREPQLLARPTNESRTSSWYEGRASRRCSNWPDIAISRSPAAARSSRAALRPHAYARVRPSANTRRASTSPPRPRAGARRAPPAHPRRAARPGGRTRLRRTPLRRRARRSRHLPSRRAGGRSPARGSSSPPRSRR